MCFSDQTKLISHKTHFAVGQLEQRVPESQGGPSFPIAYLLQPVLAPPKFDQ